MDKVMRLITKEGFNRATDIWKKHMSVWLFQKPIKLEKDGFQLKRMKGKVTVDKPIIIFPFKNYRNKRETQK